MRRFLLALLLFQAVDAFAQTVSGEIASGQLPFTNVQSFLPAPAVALAKDRTGVAIAWLMRGTGGDRISVVRLDVTGHFTGRVQTIPTPADSLDVFAPSIAAAPRGEGFTLAWLETSASVPSVTRAAYCRLDRDLKPSTPAVLLVLPQTPTTPAIVRSRKTTWISAGGSVWEIREDGTISEPLNAGFNAADMTVAADFPQLVASGRVVTGGLICPPGCGSGGHFAFCSCPLAPITSSALLFTSLYSVSTSRTLDTDAAPAIGSDGHDVVVAWLQGAHLKGGQVAMSRLPPSAFGNFSNALNDSQIIGSFGPEGGATRPDIASDGERYVMVWRTATGGGSHDVVGASIDRAGNILPLSIATSTADERDPSVVSLGDGTFLVAYEKFNDGERRIAGRIVTFEPRTRAVR